MVSSFSTCNKKETVMGNLEGISWDQFNKDLAGYPWPQDGRFLPAGNLDFEVLIKLGVSNHLEPRVWHHANLP